MPDYKIIGHEVAFSARPDRQGKHDRFYTYQRPDLTLGFVAIPEETASVELAKQAIIKAEADRRLAAPITFSVP